MRVNKYIYIYLVYNNRFGTNVLTSNYTWHTISLQFYNNTFINDSTVKLSYYIQLITKYIFVTSLYEYVRYEHYVIAVAFITHAQSPHERLRNKVSLWRLQPTHGLRTLNVAVSCWWSRTLSDNILLGKYKLLWYMYL